MNIYPDYSQYVRRSEKVVTTTTREYDTEGRLVKETVVTETTYPVNGWVPGITSTQPLINKITNTYVE